MMNKKSNEKLPVLLFLCGASGSGKSYFAENTLPASLFTPIVSHATREIREKEINGVDYHFVSETEFDNRDNFATYLDVNRDFRKPGDKKWMYGVSVSEMEKYKNSGLNLTYDVIQPRYVRELIDWCTKNNHNYDFKILHFVQPTDGFDIARGRANMPNDLDVRQKNTCLDIDFENANLKIDWKIFQVISHSKKFYKSK